MATISHNNEACVTTSAFKKPYSSSPQTIKSYTRQSDHEIPTLTDTTDGLHIDSLKPKQLSPLQQHVLFWDPDNDGIISPHDVYNGFRDIGFSIPFSILALLIPIFFSYPTRLGHSYLPDPFFRIYIDSIHKAKHGSDSGAFDCNGGFRASVFDEIFLRFDSSGTGSLGVRDLLRLVAKDRVAADPAGWSFAYMEWGTTWLLLQRDGRVSKEDLRQCYDGTLFWRLREERLKGVASPQGYGWKEFFAGPQV